MENNKIFVLHELKTIEIDVEKKIFRVNGEDFGKDCIGFTMSCTTGNMEEWFNVSMDISEGIRFRSTYDFNGNKTSEKVNGEQTE